MQIQKKFGPPPQIFACGGPLTSNYLSFSWKIENEVILNGVTEGIFLLEGKEILSY